MKKTFAIFQKTIAVIICVSFLLTTIVSAVAAPPATRGQVSELILAEGLKYNPNLLISDIIKGGGDGDLRENDLALRYELYVMLSRAFGTLPEPKGGMSIMMPDRVEMVGAPSWAEADLENIETARLLTFADELQDTISIEEVRTLVRRVQSSIGSRPQDDFYNTMSKEYIENTSIKPGYVMASPSFTDVSDKVDKDVESLVLEIVSGSHPDNTPRQKMADYYKNVLNYEARDKEGIEPIQKYLDAIDNAETLDELSDVCVTIVEELGIGVFAGFAVDLDLADSKNKMMFFGTYAPSEEKDFYNNEEKEKLFLENRENVLTIAGLDELYSKEAPIRAFNFEKELAAFLMEPHDYYDPEKIYNVYTLDEIKALFPNMDLDKLLAAYGYETPDRITVVDKAVMEEFGKFYDEKNLDVLKDLAIISLIKGLSWTLGTDFSNESISYSQKLYGIEGEISDEQRALSIVMGEFSEYLSEMYVEKFFSKEAKADVERMCEEFIATYKERISNLDWMSDVTKQKAISKLEKIGFKIGYMEKYDTEALDNAIIRSFDTGGSLFENYISINIERVKQNAREQFSPVDREVWGIPTYTVNAYYNPFDNSINFPAAILQAPFYDVNAKTEAKYGAIGVVIGHEIIHAFDTNGSKYDEDGNFADWWTEEDYVAFSALLPAIIEAYDGHEAYPGITISGVQTLFENIADLGGVAGALSIINTFDNPDYDAFFSSYVGMWKCIITRPFMEYLSGAGVHSLNKLRVNITLSHFDEFYETYDITENDSMYVAPENRVGIW